MIDYQEELEQYQERIDELAKEKRYAELRDLFLPMEPADIALLLEEGKQEQMPLLYADTLQAADFLPPTEGRWVAAPAIAAASRIGKSARVCRFTSPPPDRVNYLVTRVGEPLTPPALRFLQELKGHLLAQDNVQVYL